MEAWTKTDTNRFLKHMEKIANQLEEICKKLANPPVSLPSVTTSYPTSDGGDFAPHIWYETPGGKWRVSYPNEDNEKPDTEEKE
jgi:hypothetical protein